MRWTHAMATTHIQDAYSGDKSFNFALNPDPLKLSLEAIVSLNSLFVDFDYCRPWCICS